MQDNNEEYYTRSVTELADLVPVTTCQEVFSTTGIKLVNRGVRLDSSFFERLGRHKIMPPLEQCLLVEQGVDNAELVTLAQQLLENDPPLSRMVKLLPNAAELFEVLQAVQLSTPVIFLLTLAREHRPRLLTHSVTVALISTYLGIRLSLPRAQLIELASAGLFHDLSELRIDVRLFDEGTIATAAEREQMYTHPATSQRMLLNAQYSVEIASTVMRHHECVDGSGYPFGLMGIEMGRPAKILSIAEVAGTKLEQEAMDGVPRLEVALKLNMQKYDPALLAYLSVLYEHTAEAGGDNLHISPSRVSVPHIHTQMHNIDLVLQFWKRLLGEHAIRPRSPSAYIHQRLSSLAQASREAGVDLSDKVGMTDAIEDDKKCLAELNQINRETLSQISEIVFEVQRRWPTYQSDMTPVGKVVSGWMEHIQSLLHKQRYKND
jgi:HD-GYP domain-containing protein (c-di-GMP phosphodiesterase class II)